MTGPGFLCSSLAREKTQPQMPAPSFPPYFRFSFPALFPSMVLKLKHNRGHPWQPSASLQARFPVDKVLREGEHCCDCLIIARAAENSIRPKDSAHPELRLDGSPESVGQGLVTLPGAQGPQQSALSPLFWALQACPLRGFVSPATGCISCTSS